MSNLKNIVDYFSSKRKNFCTICFTSIDSSDKFLNVTDQVFLKNELVINLLEILNFILRPYDTNSYITSIVCHKCGELAISSYLFTKNFRDNINYLLNTTDNLTSELENIDENWEHVNAIYLMNDNKSMIFRKYYDKTCDSKSVTEAKVRLKSILETEDEDDDENEENTISNEWIPVLETKSLKRKNLKKNRKKYNHSAIDSMCEKDIALKIKCKVCSKPFPTKSNFRQHYIRVHGPKTIKCPKCLKYFGSSTILQQHQSESHLEAICSTCGKTYNNQHYLKMHELSHKICYKCELCNRVYKTQQTFNTHLSSNICSQVKRKSHSDVKFTCDTCNKQFCHKASLKVHIKVTHEKSTAYNCDWCNKKFTARSRLNAHTVKHTHVKNFFCNICNKSFVTKESLTYHTRIHTGERPYKCLECDATFISSSRRSVHIKSCHRSIQCSV